MDNNIIIFKTEDEQIKVDVRFYDESVWLTIDQMAALFERDKSTISRHIKNVYSDKELLPEATVAKFATVQIEGDREVERNLDYYNLDVIISVGYRVKSLRGTQFRQWATKRLNEYIRKGFTMDDERLKNLGGGGYWKELLERIRDIRASEKVFYRQVLDIYATSIDYDPKAEISIEFFKKVQNKIHYAVHGQTAAEVIYNRADSEKEFMGLTTFKGNRPHLSDAVVAKNYYDYIIAMDGYNLRNMKRFVGDDPDKKVSRLMDFTSHRGDVADPWYTGDFDTAWNDIYEGCLGIIDRLKP